MTPAQLVAIGELLYGGRWKAGLARDMGVDRHTVVGLSKGDWRITPGRAADVQRIVRERIAGLRAALAT